MNPEYNSNFPPNNELDLNSSDSIDDFIKQLEAKERDLHITSEIVVEIEELDITQSDKETAAAKSELEELEELLKTLQPDSSYSQSSNQTSLNSYNNQPNNPPIVQNNISNHLEAEVAKLRQQIAKTSAEKSEIQETFRRRQTDFENFRNRTERERSEIFQSVISNLATKILPVVDNLNRALESSENLTNEKTKDFKHFIEGIHLVNHQLNDVLGEMGIQPIMSIGEPFDPHYHEAVAVVDTDSVPHNTIVEELLRGYRIDNKVIRASMVKVSSSANSQSDSISVEVD